MRRLAFLLLVALALGIVGCGTPVQPGQTGTYLNAKWFVERGVPSASQGSDGDLYLDTDSTILYVKVSGAWVNVVALRGTDGSGWLFGTGAPSASLGTDGDLYLDTTSTIAYKKVGGAWSVLFTLQGADGNAGAPGVPGAPGANGSIWITGTGEPEAGLTANVGDLYLDTASGQVYKKTAGGWVLVVNFRAIATPQYVFTPHMTNAGYADLYAATYGGAPGSEVYLAVGRDGTVIASPDGTTWDLTQEPLLASVRPGQDSRRAPVPTKGLVSGSESSTSTPTQLYGVAYGAGTFVAVGDYWFDDSDYYAIFTSTDGADLSVAEGSASVSPYRLFAVTYAAGVFVAVGSAEGEGQASLIMTSTDGKAWDTQNPPEYGEHLTGVAYGAGTFVVVGESGAVLWSTDGGVTWSSADYPLGPDVPDSDIELYSVAYADGAFVAVGYYSYDFYALILRSADGKTWASQDLPPLLDPDGNPIVLCGVSGNTGFVAVGNNDGFGESPAEYPYSVILTSPNGASWTVQHWDGLLCGGVGWGPVNGGLFVITRGRGAVQDWYRTRPM